MLPSLHVDVRCLMVASQSDASHQGTNAGDLRSSAFSKSSQVSTGEMMVVEVAMARRSDWMESNNDRTVETQLALPIVCL